MNFFNIYLTYKSKKALKCIPFYLVILTAVFIFSFIVLKELWLTKMALFHTALELLCIFIALSAFAAVWFTYKLDSSGGHIVGFGFLAVAVLDIFHTYYFPALNNYSAEYFELTTRYWVVSRFVESLVLLASTFKLNKFLVSRWILLAAALFLSIGIALVIPIFPDIMPPLINNNKLTLSKKVMEYIIIIVLLITLFRSWRASDSSSSSISRYILISVILQIAAELCFTMYDSLDSFYQVLGHMFKAACYFSILKGTFAITVIYPYKNLIKAKQELEDSKKELKSILNGLQLALITFDKNLSIAFANKKALELLECNSNDILNLTSGQLSVKLSQNENFYNSLAVEAQKSLNRVISFVTSCKTMKGNPIKLRTNILNLKDEFLISFVDVRKEQELSFLKMQTQTILNSINNLVLLTDKDYNIIMVNNAFTDCMGMKYDDIIGKHLLDLNDVLQFTPSSPQQKSPAGINNGKHIEASVVTPDGSKKVLLYRYDPIINIDKEIIGHIGVFSDITDIKDVQRRMQQQEKLAIIGQMGSGIVHETKNHLAAIKGYCQLISLKTGDEQINKYISRIDSITTDVNNVITDFLSLGKPSNTVLEDVSLHGVIESIRYILESPSFMRNAKINISLSGTEKKITADRSQIKQVVLNMAKNAIEAMSDCEYGLLDISTMLSVNGKNIQLIISDNGKGISDENLSKIGTPFFTTKEMGTGLGLSVSYRIVNELGGNIEVKSRVGCGTTFIISFPCRESSENNIA